MTEKKEPEYDSLIRKLWITKGVRFTADEKLRAKSNYANFSLAILSLYLIAVSSADLAHLVKVPEDYRPYISFAVLFLSVFVLILTLIENSKNYLVQADKMHACALEVSSLYNNLNLLITKEKADYKARKAISDKYDSILAKYPNHDERVYSVFVARHYDEKNLNFGIKDCAPFNYFYSRVLLLAYWISDFWLYVVIVFSPPIMLLLFYSIKGGT